MRLDLTRLPVNAARRLSPRRLRQILGPCERVVGGLERERSGEDYCHVRRSSTISSAPICKGELINARWPSRRRSPAPSASAAAFVDGCGETPSGKCVFDRSELDTLTANQVQGRLLGVEQSGFQLRPIRPPPARPEGLLLHTVTSRRPAGKLAHTLPLSGKVNS